MKNFKKIKYTITLFDRLRYFYEDLLDLRHDIRQKNRAHNETFLDCVIDCFTQRYLR